MLDFLGIGAQKAGTTWLYEWLRQHPRISFPGGKEIHFWDGKSAHDERSYRELFSRTDRVQGEITPAYAMLPPEMIQRIAALNSSLRLIYLIRNPMQRAWSAARMALERAEMASDEASDQWYLDHFRSRGSLARGDYEGCIRRWRAVVGTEPLLILRHERIAEDPRGVLRTCCSHIGVDPEWADTLPQAELSQRVFAGREGAIPESLHAALRSIYAPRIESLAAYLGEDFGAWLSGA